MTHLHILGGHRLTGWCQVPGDKSISHRSVMFASIADGSSTISNFLAGADCQSTVSVMRALGVQIEEKLPTELVVHGRGLDGLQEPADVLDCGNSGTTLRLLTGLLAGQKFTSFLSGTEQIRRRPMDRIVQPLRRMGANITGRQNGSYAPLSIAGSRLRGFEYDMPIASAQVKSCILLAGLYAQGLTVVREPGPARDHTERLLQAMGGPISVYGHTIHCEQPQEPLKPLDITVPGDVSSAAFLIVAASIVPRSHLTIGGVGTNPTRIGMIEALTKMGAALRYKNEREQSGEPVADVEVSFADLHAATFGGDDIVTMIDELPVLAVAATQARGRTIVRNAGELRVKETDRIASTVSELRKMGAQIEPMPDGFVVEGPTRLMGGTVESQGDHRLAMALSIAALVAQGPTNIYGSEVTADSFPGFESSLQALGANLELRPDLGRLWGDKGMRQESGVSGTTRVVGLIGWPVSHSLSPAMHNAAFAHNNLNWCYVPLPVNVEGPERLSAAIHGLRALGLCGANVTVPHKQSVMQHLDTLTPAATAIGAVNTILVREDGSLVGDNTDARGFISDLVNHRFDPRGRHALVLGAGGSSRAVVYGLAEAGSRAISIANRTLVRAARLASDMQGLFPTCMFSAHALPDELSPLSCEADLVVNCTSLGMSPAVDGMPWAEIIPFRPEQTVYDLVYNPQETRLLQKASFNGAQVIGGLGMLIWQGAIAFEWWTGRPAPIAVMERAARAALRHP